VIDTPGGQRERAGDARLLRRDLSVTPAEAAERKAFLRFDDEDTERLQGVNALAGAYADPVIESFYEHLLSFEETAVFFRDPSVLARVKQRQKEYFLRLTSGVYDEAYFEDRLSIGTVHERIGLPVEAYLGMYAFYLRAVADQLREAFAAEPEEALSVFLSLIKLVFLDIGLAIETYIFERERTIGAQQEAIRDLSTPVLQVRERMLILPIIGELDASRARQLTEGLLRSIRDTRAKVVILDITGVPTVDTAVSNHLIRTIEASKLMGAKVIVTGLSPDVAQTLVTLGVDVSRLNTVGDLQGGIEEAEALLGLRVVCSDNAPDQSRHGAGDGRPDPQAG
jgi:rsbT co-antagonist protein RsbR